MRQNRPLADLDQVWLESKLNAVQFLTGSKGIFSMNIFNKLIFKNNQLKVIK